MFRLTLVRRFQFPTMENPSIDVALSLPDPVASVSKTRQFLIQIHAYDYAASCVRCAGGVAASHARCCSVGLTWNLNPVL